MENSGGGYSNPTSVLIVAAIPEKVQPDLPEFCINMGYSATAFISFRRSRNPFLQRKEGGSSSRAVSLSQTVCVELQSHELLCDSTVMITLTTHKVMMPHGSLLWNRPSQRRG